MSEKYFEKFPLISYSNSMVVNITERVVVKNFPANNAFLYYPYEIENFDRPDQIANKALDDQFMDWMLYLSNGITDPYYDWYVRDDVFNDYLKKKYGYIDVEPLTRKIVYYRNNWYNNTNVISKLQYDSLPIISKYDMSGKLYLDNAKKYYEPVYTGSSISGYQRKRVDEVIQTNKIVRYAVSGNTTFVSDEIVNVTLGYANATTNVYVSTVTGNAQVLSSNSSTVTIQHTTGYVDAVPTGYIFITTNSTIYGTESKANCTISSYSSLANNIVSAEAPYWSPVTIYESELESNAKNKTIRIIDPTQAYIIARDAADKLASQ